jgi:small subunit ribosomal protein S21
MRIEVRNNDIATAMKKLKKKMFAERILIDYTEAQHFVKPSVKRRRKQAEARRRAKRDAAKRNKSL